MTPMLTGLGEGLCAGTLSPRIPAALVIGLLATLGFALARRAAHVTARKRLEVQFVHRAQTLAFLSEYLASRKIKVLDVHFRAENHPDGSRYINVYTLCVPRCTSCAEIVDALCENPNILNAVVRDA